MNTAEKIKVMRAYQDGEVIEVTINGGSCWEEWSMNYEPHWDWFTCDYRIKEQDYPLGIPWELITHKWKYAAMDEDGEIYFYTEHPELRKDYWTPTVTSDIVRIDCLMIKKPDGKHWEKTLTKRPDGV